MNTHCRLEHCEQSLLAIWTQVKYTVYESKKQLGLCVIPPIAFTAHCCPAHLHWMVLKQEPLPPPSCTQGLSLYTASLPTGYTGNMPARWFRVQKGGPAPWHSPLCRVQKKSHLTFASLPYSHCSIVITPHRLNCKPQYVSHILYTTSLQYTLHGTDYKNEYCTYALEGEKST